MAYTHPKLHIVLTAKTRNADFKCSLCKKLFISSSHLKSHKSRRHSKHFQEDMQETQVNFRKDSKHFQENMKGTHDENMVVGNEAKENIPNFSHFEYKSDASQRMEKLLRNLSLEEIRFSNQNRWFSTPCTEVFQHPYLSKLSPIERNFKSNSEESIDITHNFNHMKCKEINRLQLKNISNTDFIINNSNQQKLYDEFGVQKSFINTNTTVKTLHYTPKTSAKCFIGENETLKCEKKSISVHTSPLINKSSSLKKYVNCSTMTDDLSSSHMDKVNPGNTCSDGSGNYPLNVVDMFTQTEGISKNESCLDNVIRPINLNQTTVNNDVSLSQPFVENNTDTIDSDSSSYDEGNSSIEHNEILEEEFQKSFEARKSLLTEDDYQIDASSSLGRAECCRNIEEKDVDPGREAHNETYVISNVIKKSESKYSNEKFNQSLMKVKCALASKLRAIGVDPNWSSITDKVYEKTTAILRVKRLHTSKKIPEYNSMRRMLNNTIEQISQADGDASTSFS